MMFVGSMVLACGICITSVRAMIDLLGIAGKPRLTDKLGRVDKLG